VAEQTDKITQEYYKCICFCPDTGVFWWRHLGAITRHYSHRSHALVICHTLKGV
jgi:hypothetical protein